MWFVLAIISMICYGIFDFLFKVAEERRYDPATVLIYFYTVGGAVAFLSFVVNPSFDNLLITLFFAIAQVSPYLIANIFKIEALKHIKSIIAFPIFGLHGAFTASLAIFLLGEHISIIQMLGIFLSLLALILLIEKRGRMNLRTGVRYAILVAFFISLSEIVIKIASNNVNIGLFITSSYFFAAIPTYVIEKHINKRTGHKKGAHVIGIALGLLNVAAFFSVILALRQGPASIIYPLIALSLMVSIILSKIIYRERITFMKWVAVIIALIAIIVLRLGI